MKLLILLLLCGTVCCKLTLNFEKDRIHLLKGQDEFQKFLQQDNRIKIVYFYTKDVKHITIFFRELKRSAEFLDMYGVKIGFANCTDDASKGMQECSKPAVENSVHTYRGGIPLLPLELETMFDVNSIMSNILQLVMLKEVPILQTAKEVEKYLGTLRGKKDVLFGHVKAIGTVEHRVFMEVAYAYTDKLQFIVCTDKKATKLFEQPSKFLGSDVSSVWWVWTKQAGDKATRYQNIRYRGNFNLKSLALFASTILKPKMFDIPAQGMEHPFSGYEVPVVRFYYNMKSREQAYQSADTLTRVYGGSVGVLLINMDDEDVKKVYMYQGMIPALSVQHSAETPEHFLPTSLESDNIAKFMEQSLGAVFSQGDAGKPEAGMPVPGGPMERQGHHLSEEEMEIMMEDQKHMEEHFEEEERQPTENIDAVEKQDDRVAELVEKTRRKGWLLDRVPALRDKTFREALTVSPTAVIMLYHPFDVVSMVNLRMFGEAADALGEQTTLTVRRVNCYDWTDVCTAENITIFPTLRVYRNGQKAWDYRGPQDTKAMYSTLKLLELPSPVYEANSNDLMKYLNGKNDESLTAITNTVVTGIFKVENEKEIEIFKQVADQMQVKERILFVYSDSKDTSMIAKSFNCMPPCVVLSRYDDSVQPVTTLTETFTDTSVQQFIQDNKLPKLTVLTPLMLPSVREKFSDLLILFTDMSEPCQQSEDVLREIVKTQTFNNVSFNMMPVPDPLSVGYKVLKKYTDDEPKVPHLSFVKFQKGEVFNFGQDFEVDMVTHWISEVLQGDVQPSAMLQHGEWKPLNRGYEYLKIIDWERKQAKKGIKTRHGESLEEVPSDNVIQDDGHAYEEEKARRLAVDNVDDSDTRKELFDLHNSRLYHHGPGRGGHHGDHMGKSGMHDSKEKTMKKEGYHSDDRVREMPEKFQKDQSPHMPSQEGKKRHDPSEL